jgi:DNA-binding NarL/FixJ family response regulator
MKTAIISHSPIFRLGFRELFLTHPSFDLVSHSLYSSFCPSLANDASLTTIVVQSNANESLATLVKQLKQLLPSVPICLLTAQMPMPEIQKWLTLGVAGFVSEDILEDTLFEALVKIEKGERFFDPLLLDSSFGILHNSTPLNALVMTKRESEIFKLTAQGKTAREIGGALFISPRTVEKHQDNLRKKMEVENKVCMIRQAQGF